MKHPTLPSRTELWQRHASMYLEVFHEALKRLAFTKFNVEEEDAISEQLCSLLRKICFEKSKKSKIPISTPNWEQPIPPVCVAELQGGKTRKRPDFTCKLCNPFAAQASDHEIHLHIECKKLGFPTSPSWIYNENYVTKGIMRFDSNEQMYGKNASSGIMIGYMFSMRPKEIMDEVNTYQNKHVPNHPTLHFNFAKRPVSKTDQDIVRTVTKPEKFRIVHLWVRLGCSD